MDIKQQTKNVAAQGRFGDSMLLHVNPAEVKGLASAMPLTVNPETGQPEAFLPFLAPMLGSLLAPTLLAGTGLSAGAMAGIGAGLATYAQTGGSGSKALLSGLTAGMGTKALGTQAQAVDPSIVARDTGAMDSLKTIFTQPEVLASEGVKAANPLDLGVKTLGSAAMSPSGMVAGASLGAQGVIQSQEEFERQMAQMGLDEEERKRRMYEMYPEQIPMASGGKTGYLRGRNVNFNGNDDYYSYDDGNVGVGNNPFPLTGGYNLPARRAPRPIPRGFMPGFQPELSYFESINPTATDLGFGQTQGFNSFAPPRRGGFGGLFGQRRRSMGGGDMMYPGGSPTFDERGFGFGRLPRFAGYGNPFMQSSAYQGFYGVPQMQQMLNPYARFVQQPMPFPGFYGRPTPPPSIGGPGPGPGGGGGSRPDPEPTPDPVPDPITPPPNVGGPVPSPKGGAFNPTPVDPGDNFVNPVVGGEPSFDPIDVTGPVPPPPPIPELNDFGFGPGIRPTEIIGPDGQFVGSGGITPPPPSMTIPIEGGADVTIPVEMPVTKPAPPMSIGGPGGGFNDNRVFAGGSPTFNERGPVFTPPTPAAPANTPMQSFGIRPMTNTPMFNAPMFAEGGDTDKELPNEGLKALAKTEKGREAVKAMGYEEGGPTNAEMYMDAFDRLSRKQRKKVYQTIMSERTDALQNLYGDKKGKIVGGALNIADRTISPIAGLRGLNLSDAERKRFVELATPIMNESKSKFQEGRSTDMMQDPIVQETIQFILGETDNSDVVNEFIVKYGQEQFMILRDQILRQAAGNLDVQTEGLIRGNGNSGMADDLPMSIGADTTAAAVSQDEYIIPADVVSMLGDGSSDAGSKQLDAMLDRVRTEKTGTTKQAGRINPNKVLPR